MGRNVVGERIYQDGNGRDLTCVGKDEFGGIVVVFNSILKGRDRIFYKSGRSLILLRMGLGLVDFVISL